MRFARFVLFASAAPFIGLGLAFLLAPHEWAAHVGVALVNATADGDARAVYGGLQLACGIVLAAAARRNELVLAGLAAQIALFSGLAGGRIVGLAIAGTPSALGGALLAGELAALAAGALALLRCVGGRCCVAPRSSAKGAAPSRGQPLGVAIRRADPSDLEELLPLVAAFQREESYDADEPSLRRTLGELLIDPRAGCAIVARERDRAIGYAVLCLGFSIELRGRDAFVDELYVVPALRGRGLGRALLRALVAEARAEGVRKLHLEVEQRNESARRLYVAEGFEATGRELLSKRLGA